MKEFSDYKVFYAKAVYGDDEIQAVIDALKNNPLCDGSATKSFEEAVADLFGKRYGIFVNSASSGLEMVMRSLNLPEFSEVITPACTFGTSYRSIISAGYHPRLVDVEIGTYVPTVEAIEAAITKNTRAILVPYLIGSIPDLVGLHCLCRKYGLIFVEDSADQIGGTFLNLPTGYYSDVVVASFYASHQVTAGGIGGMICVDDDEWQCNLKAYRDWGRKPIKDHDDDRYTTLYGVKYDKKFIHYFYTGNYKCNEMCAAFGLAQLKKIGEFSDKRHIVFKKLFNFFVQYDDVFYLPRVTPGASFTWMAFPLTIKSRINRYELTLCLENHKIQTRPLFCGNVLYHPMVSESKENPLSFSNSCYIFANSLLLGCHQDMTDEQIDYLCNTVSEFIRSG